MKVPGGAEREDSGIFFPEIWTVRTPGMRDQKGYKGRGGQGNPHTPSVPPEQVEASPTSNHSPPHLSSSAPFFLKFVLFPPRPGARTTAGDQRLENGKTTMWRMEWEGVQERDGGSDHCSGENSVSTPFTLPFK